MRLEACPLSVLAPQKIVMPDYDNTNRGALFKNARRRNEDDPLYRGIINIEGTEYWLSAWLKTSRDGDKFMSLSVRPKDATARSANSTKASAGNDRPFDDEIPF